MNEPYSPATSRPISSTSPSTMKLFMGFLAVFIVAQMIGTVLFCLYLHMKMDKMEEVLSLNEDYIFLRKIQKCQTAEGQKSTLLDCEKILKGFQDLQCKDGGAHKGQPKFEMQRGHEHLMHKNETSVAAEKRQPIAAHLAGQKSYKTVSGGGPKSLPEVVAELSPYGHGFLVSVLTYLYRLQRECLFMSYSDDTDSAPTAMPVAVLEWKTTMYGPMNNNSISYQEGKLKVKEAGLYYIYSQVSFCTKAATSAPFTLYIYLYLPMEEDRLLLKGLDTHSTSTSLCDLQSIREGGVFRLREGDMVFVNVTDSTRVNYKHGSTYFGIFKLQ